MQQSGSAGHGVEYAGTPATSVNIDRDLFRELAVDTLRQLKSQHPRRLITDRELASAIRQVAAASIAQGDIEHTEIQPGILSLTTENNTSTQEHPAKKLCLNHCSSLVNGTKEVIQSSLSKASSNSVSANSNASASGNAKLRSTWDASKIFSDDAEEASLRRAFFSRLKLDDPHIRRLAKVNTMREATPFLDSSSANIQERKYPRLDLISSLSGTTELIVEVCKNLPPPDIVKLFSISRAFNTAISANQLSSIRAWTDTMAPTSAQIFPFKLYASICVPDPTGRSVDFATSGSGTPLGGTTAASSRATITRRIPSLSWFQMVVSREKRVRDILAVLARRGHRTPPTMHITLKKLWLLLDCPINSGRVALLRNEALWTKFDLYNAQLFFIKLQMCFNDPVYGPESSTLLNLMLGQKSGLFPLWQLLRRKKFHVNAIEILQAKLRYDYMLTPDQVNQSQQIFGVPIEEIGITHLECWGAGKIHLLRPNELVPIEAVRRQIALDRHAMDMMLWGHVDSRTGENLVPSEEELYMSDSEGEEVPFRNDEDWLPRHARKKRWETLTNKEKKQILAEEEDEKLKALAWENNNPNDDTSSSQMHDIESDDDEALQALASQDYSEEELNADWSEYLAMIDTDGAGKLKDANSGWSIGKEREPELEKSSYEFMEY